MLCIKFKLYDGYYLIVIKYYNYKFIIHIYNANYLTYSCMILNYRKNLKIFKKKRLKKRNLKHSKILYKYSYI